jgi:threonine dehydratase
MVPAFHRELVLGVASYLLELFAAAELDTLYVPVGNGSGLCAALVVGDALGLRTDIVGVVSTAAEGAKLSVEQGRIVSTASATTFADGLAVRMPNAEAFACYGTRVTRMLAVSDDEIRAALRIVHSDTHNLLEGAGAAALAGLLQEAPLMHGRHVGIVFSGGNVDLATYLEQLGERPAPADPERPEM